MRDASETETAEEKKGRREEEQKSKRTKGGREDDQPQMKMMYADGSELVSNLSICLLIALCIYLRKSSSSAVRLSSVFLSF
jgi:hypothetical protein